ncbi:TraR/DksA family transcriptional regulator [Psychromonas antarctica]|jgi:DnaK suppressor protein|uniref:TraR/DksA family transcriptional regulator n=1 Tax=Psychromonas antarctica TaxID=67573 RepID=UPI001EE965D6|nr:TraR/DksA C4-type zinc finger protein [Psychromonas antarctica]MCG6200594.1 TraR/DksA C4-type zinc finger protein [Psychromonas antarctica]
MQHISEAQLNQYQQSLLNSFDKLRHEMTDILMRSNHTSHNLAANKLEKLASDDLLDMAIKIEIPSISHKISAMRSIDAALNNIAIGLYGLCADCEDEIDIQRLNNEPTTQRCLTCEKLYQKQKYNDYKL